MAATTQPPEKAAANLKKTKKARVAKKTKLQADRKRAIENLARFRRVHVDPRTVATERIRSPAQKTATYASMVQNLIEVIVDAGDKDKDFALVVGDLTLVLVKLEQVANDQGVKRCGGVQNKPEEVKEDQGVQTSDKVEDQSDEITWDE